MTEEYEDHATGAEGTEEGNNQEGDAHGVSKGQELHLFGDTGRPLLVGPELWQAAHTLYGILKERKEVAGMWSFHHSGRSDLKT